MKRSSSSIIWTILLIVVLLIVGGLVAGEYVARKTVRDQITQQFDAQQPATQITEQEQPTVNFSKTPLLWSLVTKKVPHIDITTPSTLTIDASSDPNQPPTIKGLPGAHIVVDELSIENVDAPMAQHLSVTTEVPDRFILAQAQQEMARQYAEAGDGLGGKLLKKFVRISDVKGNAQQGTLDIVFTDGAATLAMKPEIVNGNLTFQADSARLLGFDIPESVTNALTETLAENTNAMSVDGLVFDTVDVDDDSLNIKLVGNNIDLTKINANF